MTKVRFDKGIEANLPTPGMAEDGHLYLSSDNGNMYLGMPNGSLLPLNRSPYYGTCSTASETNSKVVTLDTEVFSLYGGVMITVRFENANTASSPTINVNSTGAIAVKLYGTTAAGNTPAKSWNAGEAITFVYDGSYWLLVGGGEENIGHLNTNNTTAQTPSASESFTSDINLHKVSKTGSYNDLNDTPVYALGESVGGPAKKAISIPFGQVDSTSTSTVFTATVDGITELRDGVCCYLRNDAVSSGSAVGAFGNCTNLKKIILPNTITTIGAYAFYGCTSLESINIPGSVTSIGGYAFYHTSFKKFIHRENCTYGDYVFFGNRTIEYVDIKIKRATFSILYGTGTSNNYCTFVLHGNYTRNGNFNNSGGTYVNVIIDGNLNSNFGVNINLGYLRVKGNVSAVGSGMGIAYPNGPYHFLEFMGQSNNNGLYYNSSVNYTLHLGYNAVINSSYTNFCLGANAKIYIGNGSSRQNDESTLALYLENEGWATQSNKMNTWYDYNGIYKWYYVTDNLTNCTNTNPVDWPYITRSEEYRTTIVANEGYTLGTVKVEMYSARDNALTPDEPTDITSTVYNASTGEIYIQEVVGNVIITASAS